VVQNFRELNANSLDDRYFIRDINECIRDIGRSGSTASRHLRAYTVQVQWVSWDVQPVFSD
jgi:hypothetical protein